MSAERRFAERKKIDSIAVSDLTSLTTYNLIARHASIIDASTKGFLLVVDRHELAPKDLKANLSLDALLGQQVVLFLPQMNLDLDGKVIRTVHRGRGVFEIAVEFAPEVPEYWRECLIELLPGPGELDKEEIKATS